MWAWRRCTGVVVMQGQRLECLRHVHGRSHTRRTEHDRHAMIRLDPADDAL